MAFDGVQAREMEEHLLSDHTGDAVDAFRAITDMVVE